METTSTLTLRRSTRKIKPNPRYFSPPSPSPSPTPPSANNSCRRLSGLGRGKSIPNPSHEARGHRRTSVLRPVTSGKKLASALREPGTPLSAVETDLSESLKRRTSRSSKSKWKNSNGISHDEVDEHPEHNHHSDALSSQRLPSTKKRSAFSLRERCKLAEHVGHTGGKITSDWPPMPRLEQYANRYISSIRNTIREQQPKPEPETIEYNPGDGLIDITRDQNGVYYVPQPSDARVRKKYYSYSCSSPTGTLTRSMSTLSLGDLSLAGDAGGGWGSGLSFVGSEFLGEDENEERDKSQ